MNLDLPRVFIVDDELDIREELEIGLRHEGYLVESAGTGDEAILRGVGFRPRVIVSDWLLRGHLHGLHVCEALRAVDPEVQFVFITGFASEDLKYEAERFGVVEFVEKPFSLTQLRSAVRNALESKSRPKETLPIAVLKTDERGGITFANWKARQLLEQTRPGLPASSMHDLFPSDDLRKLGIAEDRWVEVVPKATGELCWHARKRIGDEKSERLFVILANEDGHHKRQHAIRDLLALKDRAIDPGPLSGSTILLIEADPAFRRRVAGQLCDVGCTCHAAADLSESRRVIRKDPELAVVVVGVVDNEAELTTFVQDLARILPRAVLIGAGNVEERAVFQKAGIGKYLVKPWHAEALIHAATDRIGVCVECALPLPLRRPRAGEPVKHWVCAVCGARYAATFDETASADLRRNARLING